jgi:uncharacterized membrane protein
MIVDQSIVKMRPAKTSAVSSNLIANLRARMRQMRQLILFKIIPLACIIELIDICMHGDSENSWMWLGMHDDYLGIYLFCKYYLLFTLFVECTGGVSQMGLFVLCGLNLG